VSTIALPRISIRRLRCRDCIWVCWRAAPATMKRAPRVRTGAVLLERENASRLLLFGGGFSREALMALCHSALKECGGRP